MKTMTHLATNVLLCFILASCLLLASCGSDEPVERQLFAMDTTITLSAYGDNADEAVDAAEKEVNRLDKALNAEDPGSEIGGLNAADAQGSGSSGAADSAQDTSGAQPGATTLSEDACTLIQEGLQLYDKTSGLFDIAIHPIMEAWGFTTKNYRVPSQKEIDALLPHIDAKKIDYDPTTRSVSFEDDKMSIDLGGIAKGYTSARLMDIYKEKGVESGLVNLGGNIHALGTKPDGSKWRIAVEDPDKKEYLGLIQVIDKAVITSGAYERNFTEGNKTYHHIIDPATGYPAESGLKSVTIVSDDGTLADALSTSLFIMGKEKAIEFWRANSDEFDFILLDDEGTVYITSPIADDFTSDRYPVEKVELK